MKLTKAIAAVTILLLTTGMARAVRVETMASVKGMRPLRVSGQGLVTGLNGTGDKSEGAKKLIARFLDKNGINASAEDIESGSVALVNVTTEIPASSRTGIVLPLRVSALNNAQDLENGILLTTNLRAVPGGPVYVVGSGRILIGGEDQNSKFPTTANIPSGQNSGGQVVRAHEAQFISDKNTFELVLNRPSFSNAYSIAQAINSTGETNPYLEQIIENSSGLDVFDIQVKGTAQALDAGTVIVQIPPQKLDQKVKYIMSVLKNVNVSVDVPPRVVIDRTTNNVTITGEVRVSRAAIIQGNLSVMVEDPPAGTPRFVKQNPQRRPVVEMSESLGQAEHLQTLINTLNAMQVTPRDVANILQKLHSAGALHAELIVK
ncbi:MAG: flagellar basal body P-ring protein FlgI [Planctomycetota bacterium]